MDRALRRYKTSVKQKERKKKWTICKGRNGVDWDSKWEGKAKKSNFSCGCKLCKPHKHFRKYENK